MTNPLVYVHASDIKVPEGRFREEFSEVEMKELKESIIRTGLIHALTVEKAGDTWVLRAGERRLRVLKELILAGTTFQHGMYPVPADCVPVVEWNNLSEVQRLAIEIEENLRRSGFTFQERARALARYHQLRQQENPKQSAQQTATELNRKPAQGDEISAITNAVIINKHLNDPEVAKAKDEKEALKIIKKKTDAIQRAVLARTFDVSKTPHKLLKGDASAILPTLPENSFDVILTDPPYGVGADSFGDQSSTGHDYKDSRKSWEAILAWFCDESYRVAKQKAHCYVFCDVRNFERLGTLMVLANWSVFPSPLIWYKGNGMVPLPNIGPRKTYECILYAYKGDRPTLVLKNDCIVKIPGVRNLKVGAQKPVALYCDLLSRSAKPGDTVLDCFGGSGPALVAGNIRKAIVTYIEMADDAFNIATSRVNNQEIDDGAEEDDGIAIEFE